MLLLVLADHPRLLRRRPCPAGARWDAKQGCLADSLPGQLRQALPVLHIRPVTAEQHAAAVATGELYLCPVYTNMQRANVSRAGEPWARWRWKHDRYPVHSHKLPPLAAPPAAQVYSPIVGVLPLRTRQPPAKWTLASVALLLQDELA